MENPMVIMVGKTQNRWFLMEHPMNMDDDWPTGGTPISQNPHIKNMLRKYRMEKTSDTEPSWDMDKWLNSYGLWMLMVYDYSLFMFFFQPTCGREAPSCIIYHPVFTNIDMPNPPLTISRRNPGIENDSRNHVGTEHIKLGWRTGKIPGMDTLINDQLIA